MDVARRTTVARVKKCCQIMGRLENKLTAAQILYPLMHCTDIFFLKADICQLGVDQRKVPSSSSPLLLSLPLASSPPHAYPPLSLHCPPSLSLSLSPSLPPSAHPPRTRSLSLPLLVKALPGGS